LPGGRCVTVSLERIVVAIEALGVLVTVEAGAVADGLVVGALPAVRCWVAVGATVLELVPVLDAVGVEDAVALAEGPGDPLESGEAVPLGPADA